MKKLLLLVMVLVLAGTQVMAQRGYRYSDLKAGNFNLQNRKLHFEKHYPGSVSMAALEKKLKSLNDPSSGMQVKSLREDGMNGVMIRYQLDWTAAGFRNYKIPRFLRYPVNANFEVKRDGQAYRVRITDIWFSNTAAPTSQQHLALEAMSLRKQGLSITKKKKPLRAMSILDQNFEAMFSVGSASW